MLLACESVRGDQTLVYCFRHTCVVVDHVQCTSLWRNQFRHILSMDQKNEKKKRIFLPQTGTFKNTFVFFTFGRLCSPELSESMCGFDFRLSRELSKLKSVGKISFIQRHVMRSYVLIVSQQCVHASLFVLGMMNVQNETSKNPP